MSAKKQQIKGKKKGTSKPRIADVKTQNSKHETCAGGDVRSDTIHIFLWIGKDKQIINPFADVIIMKCRILIISMFIVLVLLFGCTNKTEDTVDKAVQEKNPALCKELEDPDEVKECFGLVAEKMDDPNVCL